MHGSLEIVVTRKGRKRRIGSREKNGRVQRERDTDPAIIAAKQPHRHGIMPKKRKDGSYESQASDPRAESVMGRLRLNGWISEDQYQAGVKYRDIVMRYRAIIDAPRESVSMSGVIVGPWGGGMILEAEEVERRKSNYNAAFEWLEMRSGNAGCRAVAHCAVHERVGFTPTHLKSGLDALVEHFKLTERGKSAHVRNRS